MGCACKMRQASSWNWSLIGLWVVTIQWVGTQELHKCTVNGFINKCNMDIATSCTAVGGQWRAAIPFPAVLPELPAFFQVSAGLLACGYTVINMAFLMDPRGMAECAVLRCKLSDWSDHGHLRQHFIGPSLFIQTFSTQLLVTVTSGQGNAEWLSRASDTGMHFPGL